MSSDNLAQGLPIAAHAQLSRRVRLDLTLGMAGVTRDDVHATYLRTLDKFTLTQLEVVELLVAVAVQNTCRVFLESAAAHDDALDEDVCPVCHVTRMQPCVDEDGNDVADHDGRPASYAAGLGS